MREGWQTAKLGDIAAVKGGKRVPKGYKLQSTPTEFPYITVSDFTDKGTVDPSNIKYVEREVFEQIKRYTISSGDLYVSIAGTIGKTGWVPDSLDGANLTENACKLVLNDLVEKRFVYFFTQSDMFIQHTVRQTRKSAQPKLALQRLKEIPIAVPPLPEQQRIVAILDEAFKGIGQAVANAEKNLANARELFDSYLNYLFSERTKGLNSVPLASLCNGKTITYGVIKLGEPVPDGIPCLRTSNVRRLIIDTGGMKRISPELSDNYRRTVLSGGEVLVSVRGTLGGVAVVQPEMIVWNVSREVAVVPSNQERIDSNYLAYLIATKASQDWLTGVLKGVAYTGINLADLRNLPVALPTMVKQKAIVEAMDRLSGSTRSLESVYQQKLTALTELKQSILQKAFSGELTATAVEEVLA